MCFLQFNWCCPKRCCNENNYNNCNEHCSRFKDCGCRDRKFDDCCKKHSFDDERRNNSNCCFYKCVTLCCRNVYDYDEDNKKDDCKKEKHDCGCNKRENSFWNF